MNGLQTAHDEQIPSLQDRYPTLAAFAPVGVVVLVAIVVLLMLLRPMDLGATVLFALAVLLVGGIGGLTVSRAKLLG